jgi:hypothetical protein
MMLARLALAGLLALAAIPEASAAAKAKKASGGFDGLWSVLIITEKGTCDRGYRYAVRIKGGARRPCGPCRFKLQDFR